MKKDMKKCCDWQTMSPQMKTLCIAMGIFIIVIKIIALFDLYKFQKEMEKKKRIIWTFFIIVIPPAPIIYFIYTRIVSKKESNLFKENPSEDI